MMVSVIIPIYNGEKYIDSLYTSLSTQTFFDFEMIFVNDGSTDNSLTLLKEKEANDKRVVIVDKRNGGICSARNAGILKSSGEYLIFLDQDDQIDSNLICEYYSLINKSKADLAVFGKTHYFVSNGNLVNKVDISFKKEYVDDRTKIFEYIFNLNNDKRLMTIWNCIYRKDILDNYNIVFDEHFKHGDEDGMFNIEYGLRCKNMVFSDKCLYHYYIRQGQSTITKYNQELVDNYLYFITKIYSLIKSENIRSNYKLTIVKLFILRFFSNIYIRFLRHDGAFRKKRDMLSQIEKNESFQFATSFKFNRNYTSISSKYIFWDIFSFLYRRKLYSLSVLILDILTIKKKQITIIN